MRKMDLLKHATNIAKFMDAISQALASEVSEATEVPFVAYRTFGLSDLLGGDDVELEQPVGLGDIGLDDMSLRKIIIELSTDRSHFKIWTPWNEGFIKELKRQIPKHARGWDDNERCWRIDTYWFGNAQRLLPEWFPEIDRSYTNRAIRMCEQLSREDEQEAEAKSRIEDEPEPPRRQKKQRKSKKSNDNGSGHRRTEKTETRSGRFVDDEAKEDEPQKRKKKKSEPDDEHSGRHTSPYKVLGVSPEAPDEVIKAAHKALAKMHHTDLGGNEAKMKAINEAFETIKEQRGWTTK